MALAVLENYIRQYIAAQPGDEISFAWQGGEPTLPGVSFFRTVVELEQKYAQGKRIHNAIQTNGVLLDDEWGAFLAAHQFLVGVSVDGPRELHDFYRVDKGGKPTFDKVMRGIEVLRKHRVEFNTLTVVNRKNSQDPLAEAEVTDWSVEPRAYGEFLSTIFDEWIRHDVGKFFVQHFDVALEAWMGMVPSLCVFHPTCGDAMALEHTGDLYSCDHFVYPENRLGNLMETPIEDLVASEQQKRFGQEKLTTLPRQCLECPVRFVCNGECPKHRFLHTSDGEPGLNYLCAGYKHFFAHIDPYMQFMAKELRAERAPANVMRFVATLDARRASGKKNAKPGKIGRNDPCPCGSGKKWK